MDEELTPVVARRLVDAMTPSAPRAQASQALADVTRADADGRVWVRLLGADVDTPVSTVLVAASVGQRVMVTVSGGRATIVGNASSPSVGEKAVDERVRPVSTVAAQAQEMAVSAKIAAGSAASDAAVARTSAESAQTDAQIAKDSADSAVADAATAKASAQAATDAAGVAQQEAEAASESAAQANTAANDALAQLGVVQDVTGTLAWVTEHGSYEPTQDATVQDGKVYFVRTGSEPYTYVLVSEPRDADIGTYYELSIDEALSQYVSSHLALTDAGLYVTKDASGYRVLLASDGMSVVDPQGHTVAKYGTGTTFAADRDWYVGSAKAFVFYDASEGTLQIGGSDVTIGGKAPADLLTSLDVSVTQTSTGADITVNGDTVSITNGQDGTDGKTYYTHIRYSESADGTGHVASPTASTVYIGTYTGTSSTAPSSKTSYKWSKYVGKDGTDGHSPSITTSHSGTTTTIYADGTSIGTVEDGADGSTPSITASKSGGTTTVKVDGVTVATIVDGTSVTVSKVEYGTSASASTSPSSWSTTVPTSIAKGRWLWVKTTYSDGKSTTTKSYVGTDGEDGTSVYVKSASKSGDTTTVVIADSDGNESTLTIKDGEDGSNGTDGKSGYVHTAWANSADGTTDFSTTASANKKYLGVYTDNTQADSTSPSAYSWSLIRGADGHSPTVTATKSGGTTTIKVDGTTIATVDDGEDGTTPTVTTRKNSDGSTTVVINGSDSATIENGTDGTSYYTYVRYSANADGSGMVASPTSATKYIGVYSGTSASVPAYTSFKWSKYVGEDGNDAAPLTVTATSTEYQLSTSGTEVPTGEWSATPLAPTQTEFLWTKTTLTFSDGTTATSYSVGGLAGAKGDKGDQGDTGPEGIVSVTPDAIDWEAGTATLRATLWVNGEDVQPTAWSWTKNLDSTVLGTGQTLEVTDLDATYRCTVTW